MTYDPFVLHREEGQVHVVDEGVETTDFNLTETYEMLKATNESERTFAVLTKLDLMDKGTNAVDKGYDTLGWYHEYGNSFLYFYVLQHLEAVIRARIPNITSLINKTIDELESEMDHLGRPIALDAGTNMERIMKARSSRGDSSMAGYMSSKKTMEINPENSIMEERWKTAFSDQHGCYLSECLLGLAFCVRVTLWREGP
ncbi:hypothetical protein IFM89_029897, partial [Coptis chinensis]